MAADTDLNLRVANWSEMCAASLCDGEATGSLSQLEYLNPGTLQNQNKDEEEKDDILTELPLEDRDMCVRQNGNDQRSLLIRGDNSIFGRELSPLHESFSPTSLYYSAGKKTAPSFTSSSSLFNDKKEDFQSFGAFLLAQSELAEMEAGADGNRGGASLFSPDTWMKLIDEIYLPMDSGSDLDDDAESAISDELEAGEKKANDFFRVPKDPGDEKSSDSGDADDEFECDCEHCQLLRNLSHIDRNASPVEEDTAEDTEQATGSVHRADAWETDWTPSAENAFNVNLDDLHPLEPFLSSLQDLPQDPVDLMFQNVIMQMLAVHPELLGEQAPPPVPLSVIDSLPVITATSENIEKDLSCPVCLCHFEEGEELMQLPCQHLHHPLCIQAWLAKSGTCPVCRHVLQPS